MYVVAEEKTEDIDGPIVIISKDWLTPRKTRSFWPSKSVKNYNKALANNDEPDEEWTIISLKRRLYTTDDLLRARKKAKEAERFSDLTSTEDESRKRKRRPVVLSSSDSEDEKARCSYNLPRPKPISQIVHISKPVEQIIVDSLQLTELEVQNQSLLGEVQSQSLLGEAQSQLLLGEAQSQSLIGEAQPNFVVSPAHQDSNRVTHLLLEIREQNQQILQWISQQNRKEILAVSKTPIELPVDLPLASHTEFQKLEQFLVDDQNFSSLCTYLSSRIDNALTRAVNYSLKHLMTEQACDFNFKGRNNKKSFETTILFTVILRAVKKSTGASDINIQNSIKVWLKHAPQRYAKAMSKGMSTSF